MGKALAEAFPAAREVFEQRRRGARRSAVELIFEGPEAELTLTANAQPALMATSLAALRALESEAGLDVARDAAFVAGHSLGEYSALLRGRRADARGRGAAAAHSRPGDAEGRAGRRRRDGGDPRARVRRGVGDRRRGARDLATGGDLRGRQRQRRRPGRDLRREGARSSGRWSSPKLKGAKRALPLPVSAPFHCPLMQPAADAMAEALTATTILAPKAPLVANVSASAAQRSRRDSRQPRRAGDRRGALARKRRFIWRPGRRRASSRSAPARCSPAWSSASPTARAAIERRNAGRRRRPIKAAARELKRAERGKAKARVRSDRKDGAGHRRLRRHRRRDRARAARARARPSRSPARGARRWRRWPANSATRAHVLPCDLADAAAVEALVPAAEAAMGRSTSSSTTPASRATICSCA